ncbi:unnamed protein product, partial [Cylicostephanus goldi]
GGVFKTIIVSSDERNFCYLSECNELAIVDSTRNVGNVATLIEMYDGNRPEQLLNDKCTFHLMERPHQCTTTSDGNVKHQALSAYPGRGRS